MFEKILDLFEANDLPELDEDEQNAFNAKHSSLLRLLQKI